MPPPPEWGPYCGRKGCLHQDLNIMVGWHCHYCGAKNPGSAPHIQPPTIAIDDSPAQLTPPSKQSMIVASSQLQPIHSAGQLPPVAEVAQRAQYKNQAVMQRMQSIDGRPFGQNKTAVRGESRSKSHSVVVKIAFDVSYIHLVWTGNIVSDWFNACGT